MFGGLREVLTEKGEQRDCRQHRKKLNVRCPHSGKFPLVEIDVSVNKFRKGVEDLIGGYISLFLSVLSAGHPISTNSETFLIAHMFSFTCFHLQIFLAREMFFPDWAC